jgi:tetratricopeptide (TPR) repeat protein
MENNKLIIRESEILKKVSNAIAITNKLLSFYEETEKYSAKEITSEKEDLLIKYIEKEVRTRLAKDYLNKGMYKMDPDIDPNYNSTTQEYNPDYKGAIKDFTIAIEANPEHYEAYSWRGFCKRIIKDYEGAINDYKLAIEFAPEDSSFYRGIALVQKDIGNLTEAMNYYSQAIKVDSKDIYAYQDRAGIKYKLGDYEGAINDYTKSIGLHPSPTVDYEYRGNAKYNLGDKSGACLDWKKAAEKGIKSSKEKINKHCR